MAFGRRQDDVTTPSRPAAPPSPPPSGSANLTAFIDQGSQFEGKLSFKDTVRIDGRFQGEISSENTLIVGETGEIEASIKSTNVIISGSVVGDIHASRSVVLHKSAVVQGNIESPSFVVEEGAVFNGQVKMASDRAKSSANLKAIQGGPEGGVKKPETVQAK